MYTQTKKAALEGIDKGNLIQEAQSWSPNETVNWTALAKRYGVTTPNVSSRTRRGKIS